MNKDQVLALYLHGFLKEKINDEEKQEINKVGSNKKKEITYIIKDKIQASALSINQNQETSCMLLLSE